MDTLPGRHKWSFFEIRKSIYLFSLKLFSYGLKKCKQDKVNSTSCILYWVSTFSAIFQSYLLMKGIIFKIAVSHNENFPHLFFSIHWQLIRTSIYIQLMPLSHLALSIILRCKSLLKIYIYIYISCGCYIFWISLNTQHLFLTFLWVTGLLKNQLFVLHFIVSTDLLFIPSRCMYLENLCLLLPQRVHLRKLPLLWAIKQA